jgi:NAD(P)-dependent dehydrogenase (short-subunit alcohol dehydrogenase family)
LKNLFDLNNRFAIVTGGAGLLGSHHAQALMENNCNVEIWDIDAVLLDKTFERLKDMNLPGNLSKRIVNITRKEEVQGALQSIIVEKKVVQILINNAALNPKPQTLAEGPPTNFENYPMSRWEDELAVGLTGSIICCQVIGSYMAKQKNGVILNIASDLSVIAPDQRIYEVSGVPPELQFKKPVSYSVIKAGLVGLTKYLATYWAESGVRINALSPGGVFENHSPDFVKKLTNLIPMGRMATESEYYGAVQFLCSDASSYMTGQNIVMDGGRSIW